MEAFLYITNFVPGETSAKMFIDRKIGDGGINGGDFARELNYLKEGGAQSVVIDINSVGGSIVEGFSIFSAIQSCQMKTTTRVVGIAASMAGIISQAGDNRVIMDYGIFHAHGPQVPAGVKVETSLVAKMLESLKTMIGAKAKLTPEALDELMSKESIFTALEALELGFFDEIEKTSAGSPVLSKEADAETMYNIVNQFITKPHKMKELNSFFKLENANEDVILKRVQELQAKADQLEGKDKEILALTNRVNEVNTLNAETLVNSALESGKISKESVPSWISQAKNTFDLTKTLLDGLSASKTAVKVINSFDKPNENESWTYAEWGTNDPKGLEEMKNSSPEKFDKLLTEYIK
jgi:ATP-dependent protease ClpP protease subunit